MDITTNRRPLKPDHSALYKRVNGVTYFKLKSEFDGDYTKNCGLLAEELDENFYFLRGYDIEDVRLIDEGKIMITRVDKGYKPIVIDLNEEMKKVKIDLDRRTGTLIITYPDGTKDFVGGFAVDGMSVRVATDDTIDGCGTIFNPLRVSPTELTGTFAPATDYVDISENGNIMPNASGHGRGYRIVTKEKIDHFGRLYGFDAVEKINNELKETGSEWRVPSKNDWDDLLNAMECKDDRNHDSLKSRWLGKVAGVVLKSTDFWKEYDNDDNISPVPTEGKDLRGLTIYPLGMTPDRNEVLMANDYDAEGYKKLAGMWTSTRSPEGNAFVKLFAYNHADVDQDTYGRGAKFSIRLVKDYHFDNYNEIETILGLPYPCELVRGLHGDYPYIKIWTKINLYTNEYGGVVSKQWSAATAQERREHICYFVNEWDGKQWDKKLLEDGDSVVIADYPTASGSVTWHEWRVIDGELVDTVKDIMDEFEEHLTDLGEAISGLSAATKEEIDRAIAAESELNRKIEEEEDRAMSAESALNAAIEAEEDRAIAVETALNEKIQKEIDRAISADTALNEALQAEKDRAIAAESALNAAIEAEEDRAMSAETALNDRLQAEIDRAVSADTALNEALQAEKDRAIAAESELNKKIEDNKDWAEENFTQLNDKLQKEIDRAVSADTALNEALQEEKDRAIAAESALNAAIEAEEDRAMSAETALNEALQEEKDRAIAAESELNAAIEAEEDRAMSAETALNEALQAEKDRAIAAESELNRKIEEEKDRAIAAESELNEKIEAEEDERIANDYIPGQYVLSGDSAVEMVIPTYGESVDDIKIRVSDDFFNFGTF